MEGVNASIDSELLARMAALDKELWARTPPHSYDKEKNREAMQRNRQARLAQGLEADYQNKWRHSSQESSSDCDDVK
jgi:hypothetical protein